MTNANDEAEFNRACKVLAELAGEPVAADEITDYAVVIATEKGTSLLFSGDRRTAAVLFSGAAGLVTVKRGTSGRADGALPPMGRDN